MVINFKNNEFDKYKSSGIKINSVGLIKTECSISNFYDENLRNYISERLDLNGDGVIDFSEFKIPANIKFTTTNTFLYEFDE